MVFKAPAMQSTGAEPPSPQQSQSPMHEEAPEQLPPAKPSPQSHTRHQHTTATPQPKPQLEVR